MTRVAQRHAKHPRPTPLAGRGLERRRAAEEIDLRFGPGGAMKDAHGPTRRRDRPHESLHRLVARAVAVLLDQVLPDPLHAQARVELLGDRLAIDGGAEPRPRRRAGERFGRFWLRAGEHFGRFCILGRPADRRIRRWRRSEPGNVLAAFARRWRSYRRSFRGAHRSPLRCGGNSSRAREGRGFAAVFGIFR